MPTTIIDSTSASKAVSYRGKFSGDFIVRLGSSDTFTLDLSKVGLSSLLALGLRPTKNGDDIFVQFVNVKTEKVLSSVTLEGAAAPGGLNRVLIVPPGGAGSQLNSLDGTIIDEENFSEALFIGTSGDDALTGNDDPDVSDALDGGAGNDTLVGGAGDDDISGGSGNDVLTGGAGEDEFSFDFASDFFSGNTVFQKIITDFGVGGNDSIDIETLGHNLKLKASTTATTANWKKGQIIFQAEGANGRILGNLDKDTDAEIVIVLTGVNNFDITSIDLSLKD